MLLFTKVLIHDERPHVLAFLLKLISRRGYNAGLAKDGNEIITMLANDQCDIVLTNSGYKELNPVQHTQLKSSSVLVIDIKDSLTQNQDMKLNADLYLPKCFSVSELWQVLKKLFMFYGSAIDE
ncbi:MAG TPA: hypothetical protein VMT12_01660 [Syntrophales bacterium]|nr:hypothetical protein [Syntrophales bacterium]